MALAMTTGMAGKVCLVTGATSGIGLAAARELARLGATVILVARDKAKGAATVEALRNETGNDQLSLLLCDFSSQASIRTMASAFLAAWPRLDVLVNNAGGIQGQRRLTEDGLEMTFAVNHLGYFLLTALLLERLKASAPARIVNVASAAHRGGRLDLEDLQSERRYRSFAVYSASKLANIAFTFELARRLEGSKVTANCLHPGVVGTGFGASGTRLLAFLMKLGRPLLTSPKRGAETIVYLASSPEVAGISGRYFSRCKPVGPSRAAQDAAPARKLWQASERLTGLRGES